MADKTMQAVQYDHYGGGVDALKLVEVRIPKPKKGEMLVKVEASSINPVDWKIQKGMIRPFVPGKFPHIPGTDIAGEVVSIGPNVKDLSVGDKVVSWLPMGSGGSLAQYAVASAKYTVKRPHSVSAVDGSCLPIAGITALQAVRDYIGIKLDGSSQMNVLVTAASGGVGHYAVQLAKLGGAHVTATCGSRNIELVKSLGADEVLDYKTPEGAELKSPSGLKYDAVIHCTIGIPWSKFKRNMAPKAKLVDMVPTVKSVALNTFKKLTFPKQKAVAMMMSTKREDLQLLVDLMSEGKIKSVVDSEHTLSKVKDAWSKSIEGHATGKVVIKYVE